MKIFFFLVLLTNIVFFLWEYNSKEEKVLITNKNNTTEKIFLLSELSKNGAAKVQVEVDTDKQQGIKLAEKQSSIELENKSFCYQVGPFLSETLLDDWLASNDIDISMLTKVNEMKKKVTGFLVYYPQADTYEQSKKNIQMLENKGFTDFWLFRTGELKGNISLGLFVKKSRAILLQERLLKAGVNVQIMPRYRTESMWYVNILSNNKVIIDKIMLSEQQSFLSCDHI